MVSDDCGDSDNGENGTSGDATDGGSDKNSDDGSFYGQQQLRNGRVIFMRAGQSDLCPSSAPLVLTYFFFHGHKKCSHLSAQNSCVIGLKGFKGRKKM